MSKSNTKSEAKTKADTKTSIRIQAEDRNDKERFVGTNKNDYQVQTNREVSVPEDVKETVMLSRMQKFQSTTRISEMELKD